MPIPAHAHAHNYIPISPKTRGDIRHLIHILSADQRAAPTKSPVDEDATGKAIESGGGILISTPTPTIHILISALKRIERWEMPHPKFEIEQGANGARDYIQEIARKALNTPHARP